MSEYEAGIIRGIAVRPARDAPMELVEAAQARAGGSLEGDHADRPKRGVTLLSEEQWAEVCAELGADLPWHTRRANLLVSGLAIGELGVRIRIGQIEVEILGETKPCQLMDTLHQGLREKLVPNKRGGVHGRIVVGGTVHVGDEVEYLDRL